jgi:hypothetical protein
MTEHRDTVYPADAPVTAAGAPEAQPLPKPKPR